MMALFEADSDCLEIKVIFPGEEKMRIVGVNITDVNGDDLTVKEVKRQLLLLNNTLNYQQYTMLGGDGSKYETLKDSSLITEYFKYLSPSTGHLTFRHKDSVPGT